VRYYLNTKLNKKNRKELESQLVFLDKVIMRRCKDGADILSIISSCKPYVDENGAKEFASTREITRSVGKLVRLKVLSKK